MITDKEYFHIQFNIADAFEWAMHNTHTSYASITLNEHQASLQLYTFSTYDGPDRLLQALFSCWRFTF